MKVGVVIPWREQPSRVPAFNAVVAWYKEHLPEAELYYPNHPGDVWLPSHTRNDGVRQAEQDGCDVIVMNDADTIPQIAPLRATIMAAYRDNKLHNPYTRYRMLEDRGTKQFLAGTPIEQCHHTPFDAACFGTVIFTPQAWWKLGGMDEKFMQWGYEDTAMQVAHSMINGTPFIKHKGIAFALGHVPQPRNTQDYYNNKELFQEYRRVKTADEMLKLVKRKELFAPIKFRKLNILAYVKLYPPMVNAGGELMLHQMLVDLKSRGHEVTVMCDAPTVKQIDGIKLVDEKTAGKQELIAWADVVFTQLHYTAMTVRLVAQRKPIVHVLHNDKAINMYKLNNRSASLFVANSSWIQETVKLRVRTLIVNPPTKIEDYRVKPGNAITLINLSENKGSNIFWQLARIFPDRKFIGVKGGYDKQIMHDKDLPNVTIYDNTPDIKKVYEQTGILLMPSTYESWGRVAMEAAASGIPTIASPTPGLRESIGDGGIFVEHNDIAGYVEAIRMLDDKKTYDKYSQYYLSRAESIDTKGQMDRLNAALITLA